MKKIMSLVFLVILLFFTINYFNEENIIENDIKAERTITTPVNDMVGNINHMENPKTEIKEKDFFQKNETIIIKEKLKDNVILKYDFKEGTVEPDILNDFERHLKEKDNELFNYTYVSFPKDFKEVYEELKEGYELNKNDFNFTVIDPFGNKVNFDKCPVKGEMLSFRGEYQRTLSRACKNADTGDVLRIKVGKKSNGGILKNEDTGFYMEIESLFIIESYSLSYTVSNNDTGFFYKGVFNSENGNGIVAQTKKADHWSYEKGKKSREYSYVQYMEY